MKGMRTPKGQQKLFNFVADPSNVSSTIDDPELGTITKYKDIIIDGRRYIVLHATGIARDASSVMVIRDKTPQVPFPAPFDIDRFWIILQKWNDNHDPAVYGRRLLDEQEFEDLDDKDERNARQLVEEYVEEMELFR